MDIAHVALFPPFFEGTGTVCYYNALSLAHLGHDITLYTSKFRALRGPMDPSVHHRPLRHLFRIENALFTPGVLGISGHALIHLHQPFIFGAEMTWLNCKLRGIPYVVTYHSDLIGKGHRRPAFAIYQHLVTPLVLREASKVIVVAQDHARSSKAFPILESRWSTDVVEVPNGVDGSSFHPSVSGECVRARYGVHPAAKLVLFAGALDRAHRFTKGIPLLMHAVALLGRDVTLMIVGDGELKAAYAEMAVEYGIAHRVAFAGRVSHAEMPDYCAASDLVVLPSLPPESFGLVLLEAMACAKPVVASNIPGVRTVVRDGDDGLLVRPGDVEDLRDKMEQLLSDSELRREMGSRGRAKVEKEYSWGQIARRLEQVYEQALHD